MQTHDPIHVLVIEDDADTRANLCDILELDDHRVELAGSLAEARIRTNWADISIILLDRKLPDGNAEDILPELRRLAPHAEVLIVTGYRDLEAALTCLHEGAADYILKPINPEALRANLRRIARARQVAQQLNLLDTAVRDVKEGILITDGELDWPGPRILFVNDALTMITGYSREQLIGQTPRIFHSERTDRTVLENLKAQLRKGHPFTGVVINRRDDGREYFADLHVSPVFDTSGRVRNFVSTQRDITARKIAEERMLQAERLAAIGEMVTGLAHESRNALQRSMACLDTLATEVEDRPDALDLVKRAQRAQSHLQHLYEEVRSYAAPLNLHHLSRDISEIWREAWSELEHVRKGRDARLHEETEGVNLVLDLDAFAVGQVFRNIFENALVACSDPSEILVRCVPTVLAGKLALQILICDNGPGLSAEQLQRVFEPFYTTRTKGTGLGMAISKRIVEAHGGVIAVENDQNRGARFSITLPRRRPEIRTGV